MQWISANHLKSVCLIDLKQSFMKTKNAKQESEVIDLILMNALNHACRNEEELVTI